MWLVVGIYRAMSWQGKYPQVVIESHLKHLFSNGQNDTVDMSKFLYNLFVI